MARFSNAPGADPRRRITASSAVDRSMAGRRQRYHRLWPDLRPARPLPGKLDLPADIAENDFIEFSTVGAYGAATATRFNGYGSAATAIVADSFTG